MYERINELEQRIIATPEVLDPEGVHHVFKNGGHGRKLDLEKIPRDGELYYELIQAQAEHIAGLYPYLPQVLVGVADGGNRLAQDIARALDNDVVAVETEKNRKGKAVLPYMSRLAIRNIKPDFVLIIDDVGTSGRSIAPVAEKLTHNVMRCRSPIERVEAYVTWLRQPSLPILEKPRLSLPYHGLITTQLTTFKNAEVCNTDPDGYCAQGHELIPYGT